MDQSRQGFTLIEVAIVLIIVSIIAVVTFITLPNLTINVGAQAQQLLNNIRYAQSLSMSKGQRYRFVKLSSNSYEITDSSGTAILLAMGTTTVTFTTGISFGTLTNLPNNLVAFDGAGTPYVDTGSPGTALSSTATIPITSGTTTKTISISPQTGRMILQ